MTAYNREKYIVEAIESVLASTYTNFELIIVDDGSTDKTVQIAESYALIDKRIKVYINEKNLGDYPNRNKAASYAKGTYLKYVDSDDIIYPWCLTAMVYCMEQHPNAGYGLICYNPKFNKCYPVLLTPDKAYYAFFFDGSMITTVPTGAIIKREVFELEQGFSGKPYVGDTEMWLKLSLKYSMVAMPIDLIWWRQHEDQQYRLGVNNNYYEQNSFNIFLSALVHPLCPFTALYKQNAIRNLKNRYVRNIGILFLKGKIGRSLKLRQTFNLTILDFIKGLRFNNYPPQL